MCLVTQSCLTLCDPVDCSLPAPLYMGILQTRIVEWVAVPFSRGSSQPGIEPRSPSLQVDSLPSELPGKSKNSDVGRLSLLPDPGIEPRPPALQRDSLPAELPGKPQSEGLEKDKKRDVNSWINIEGDTERS